MELRRASPSCGPDATADRVSLTNFYRRASALDERGQGDFIVPSRTCVREAEKIACGTTRRAGASARVRPRALATGQFNSSRQLLAIVLDGAGLCSGA